MKQMIQIRCKNNKKTLNVEIGSTLSDVFRKLNISMPYGPISAKVNNKVEGMHFRLYHNKDIEFLDMHSASGSRAYTRTLFFVLCKAVHDLYPDGSVVIDIPVSNGYYCDLKIGQEVNDDTCNALRSRMQQIISEALPITRHEAPTEEVMKMFADLGAHSKVELLRTSGRLYTTYYDIGGYLDYFYGTLLTNTSQLYLFGLEKYYDGLLLRIPSPQNAAVLGEVTRQDKMFEIFKEHHRWQDILGMGTVGAFNAAVENGLANSIVNVSEALQEKKIAAIAEQIAARKGVKMVLIAGPSSSGKTTTCKRLSIQLLTCGIRPVPISLDDYFVDRENTPLQPNGDYDYEALEAIDLELFNDHLRRLIRGESVDIPRYDFITGRRTWHNAPLTLDERSILIIEGIHGLNPRLTPSIPDAQKFRIYISCFTSVAMDNLSRIATTDNRLLRRLTRDYRQRGADALSTLSRWASVRRGEEKHIFPYQENADIMLNSSLFYEISVLRPFAEKILREVPDTVPEYDEAQRMLKFLDNFIPIPPDEIPPTSILREFIGGSSFQY